LVNPFCGEFAIFFQRQVLCFLAPVAFSPHRLGKLWRYKRDVIAAA
jgi:hypothetical protein